MTEDIDVFVSYSRTDQAIAEELIAQLRAAGLRVWWDYDLPRGGQFRQHLLDAVEGAKSIVVLWSDASVASPWIAQEALIGLDREVLVPLTIGNPLVPPGLGALQAMPVPTQADARTIFLQEFAGALTGVLTERTAVRRRRGLLIDIARYNRLSVLRMLAWSILLGGIAGAAAAVAGYGSGDMDNALFNVGVLTVGFLFAARWAVGARRDKIFVGPEPFFSGRMIAVMVIVALIEIAMAILYDTALRQAAEPAGVPNLSFQGRMLFTTRALSGAVLIGLLCAPLIRLGFALAARLRRRMHARRSRQEPGSGRITGGGAPGPATRTLVLAGAGLWTTVLLGAAAIPDVSRLDARRLAPGTQFNDCGDQDWCPAMIILPAGRGVVGSAPSEPGHKPWEAPRRRVALSRLAIGKHEITIGQWGACVADGGCSHRDPLHFLEPDQRYRTDHPIANLSWKDTQEYVRWLSRRTGQRYRLPSEAEWEYAARGGTATPWFWGNDPRGACLHANGREQWTRAAARPGERGPFCSDGVDDDTARTGRYRPNGFGLHDMSGNVSEWVEDCWTSSHAGAPSTGAARRNARCQSHVVKDASYDYPSESLRPANRKPGSWQQEMATGLRVVREL